MRPGARRTLGQKGLVPGSSAEALAVDSVFPDLVANDTLRRMEELRRLCPIATSGLQGILDQVAFKRLDGVRERHLRHCSRAFGSLQRGGQMIAMDDLSFTDEHGTLDGIFELAHIARPGIAGQEV